MKLIEKFVHRYLERHCPPEYIHRDRIKDALQDAKANENVRLTAMYRQYAKELEERLQADHATEIERLSFAHQLKTDELRAHIAQLEEEMAEMDTRAKHVERVHSKCFSTAKKNSLVASDVKYMADQLHRALAPIIGKATAISHRAELHVEQLERDQDADRIPLS